MPCPHLHASCRSGLPPCRSHARLGQVRTRYTYRRESNMGWACIHSSALMCASRHAHAHVCVHACLCHHRRYCIITHQHVPCCVHHHQMLAEKLTQTPSICRAVVLGSCWLSCDCRVLQHASCRTWTCKRAGSSSSCLSRAAACYANWKVIKQATECSSIV